MFNSIDFKKITATSCLAMLMSGTVIPQPASGASIINVCRQSNSSNSKFLITLNHNGQTLEVIGEQDNGKKLHRGKVKTNLKNNYGFSDSKAQKVKDDLKPYDILITETPLCQNNSSGSSNNSGNGGAVSVELVLSVDVSGSVSDSEFELQRNGYIKAFEDSAVQQAIKDLPNGLAVNMQFWASNKVIDTGWYKLIKNDSGGIDNLNSFIQEMKDVVRNKSQSKVTVNGKTVKTGSGTDIALAINEAKKLLLNNNYDGEALVIDVSGDGVSDDTPYSGPQEENGDCPHAHFCPPLEAARDAAVAAGITINGLPIVNDQNRKNLTHEIDIHYEQLVVGGDGAFVEVANDFSGFTTAAKNKILREITEAEDRVTDTDGDGITDAEEGKSENLDTDGDGIPNYEDDDSDNDGTLDAEEGLLDVNGNDILDYLDSNYPSPDYTGMDTDGDGISDAEEGRTNTEEPDSDEDGDPDYNDIDSDNNGIPDSIEVGDVSNPDNSDSNLSNSDSIPDYKDPDDDNNDILDVYEIGNDPSNPIDSDNNGTPDYKDPDNDGDLILDKHEAMADSDENGFTDEGVVPLTPTATIDDIDGDGTPNSEDNDSDEDGLLDSVDPDPYIPNYAD